MNTETPKAIADLQHALQTQFGWAVAEQGPSTGWYVTIHQRHAKTARQRGYPVKEGQDFAVVTLTLED